MTVQEQEGDLNSDLDKKVLTTTPVMDTHLLIIRVEVYVESVTTFYFVPYKVQKKFVFVLFHGFMKRNAASSMICLDK